MRIDESRQHGIAFRVDDLGPVGNVFLNVRIVPDSNDLVFTYGNRFVKADVVDVVRIGGDHLAI